MSKVNNGLFSSNSPEYETPDDLFRTLDSEFHFTLDVCATATNRKVERYFDKETDGLRQNWGLNVCWMNPPYGSEIGSWIKKAYEESYSGATIVCLIPARTDTKYWHNYVMKSEEVRFIEGRLQFSEEPAVPIKTTKYHLRWYRVDSVVKLAQKSSAPFPSCIVVFRSIIDQKNIYNVPIMRSLLKKEKTKNE